MRRVYLPCKGGVKESPFAVDDSGNIYEMKITNSGVIPLQMVPPLSPVILPKKSLKMTQRQIEIMNRAAAAAGLPPAYNYVETPNGGLTQSRNEVSSGQGGSRRTLKIVLSNEGATAADFVIGDGFGLFALKTGVATKPGTVIVGGTYGTQTLAVLSEMPKACSLDLHGFHIINTTTAGASSESFFGAGKISQFIVSPDMQVVKEIEVPISDEVGQDANKDNIRANANYKWNLDGYTGWRILLPAGEKIVLTFRNFISVGKARQMVLLDSCA